MSVQDKQQDKPTMTARLAELEASVATAIAKQRELREAKEAAVRDVRDKQEALVRALAEDLDGAATVEQKALSTAEKVAAQPWDAKIEAAGRLIEEARRRRAGYLQANIDGIVEEMSVAARAWPERARQALEALYDVAREYDDVGLQIERLAREAGRADARIPTNPLPVTDLKRSLRTITFVPPIPVRPEVPAPRLEASDGPMWVQLPSG